MSQPADDWKEVVRSRRLVAGLSLGRRSGRLKVVLFVPADDNDQLAPAWVRAQIVTPEQPHELTSLCQQAKAVLQLLLGDGFQLADAIELIGLGRLGKHSPAAFAHQLVEQTGITVVHDFQRRDIAAGGLGGPLSLIPDFHLFKHARYDRLLLHFGRSLRLSFLPSQASVGQLLCYDVGPACGFLDSLIWQLSEHRFDLDPSGHFAVQGSANELLIEQWMTHPYLLKTPPKFLAEQTFDDAFVEASIALGQQHRVKPADIICSACHFVIRCLQDDVRRGAWRRGRATASQQSDSLRVLPAPDVEVIVTGGGLKHGLLSRLFRQTFSDWTIKRSDELGVPSEARSAIHAALLALFALDLRPGNAPNCSGASGERVLANLCPDQQRIGNGSSVISPINSNSRPISTVQILPADALRKTV